MLGRFPIIDRETFPAACTSLRTRGWKRLLRPKPGPKALVLIALAAYFGCTTTGLASARAEPRAPAVQRPEIRQYHGLEAWQYHQNPGNSGQASASLGRSRELNNSISALVISRLFSIQVSNSAAKTSIYRPVATPARIGSQNDPSIGVQIVPESGGDPRLMLDIGTVLGLCYAAFLAVWFWATRFRLRPRSNAPS
jgi:hypothetical protein